MWKLPVVGWFLSGVAAVSLSVPFWICWTVGGIGQAYFYWLPPTYRSIPFWHCVGLFVSIQIIGTLIKYVTPRFVSVNNTTNVKRDEAKEGTTRPQR